MTTDPRTIRNLRQQRDEWFRQALVLRRLARVYPQGSNQRANAMAEHRTALVLAGRYDGFAPRFAA